jgi:hypothetical protein
MALLVERIESLRQGEAIFAEVMGLGVLIGSVDTIREFSHFEHEAAF